MTEFLRRVRSQPLSRLPGRAARIAARRVGHVRERRRDRKRYVTPLGDRLFDVFDDWPRAPELAIEFPSLLIDDETRTRLLQQAASPDADAGFNRVAMAALEHQFQALGSGPLHLTYETGAIGAFGERYEMAPGAEAAVAQRRKMSDLVDRAIDRCPVDSSEIEKLKVALLTYRPIDWHVDFKSGYRWDPEIWYMDIPIGLTPGADIKVPWELSRGHHLVALALAGAGGQLDGAVDELSLQILDWVAANPVRFGANWRSAMDVSIRAANWCWALALAGEDAVPAPIRYLAAASLYEHGLFIESHLDFARAGSTNHYLADIVGLLHIAAVLPEAPGADGWAALAVQELVVEMGRTVNPDGSSYEGSTGYHRLVTEMFLHGTLAASRIPVERRRTLAQLPRIRRRSPRVDPRSWDFDPATTSVFPEWYHDRLRSMTRLIGSLTKPNGLASQLGDQDSGRFLKFDWPAVAGNADFVEEPRDHRHLLATRRGLYDNDITGPELYSLEMAAGSGSGLTDRPGTDSDAANVVRHDWADGDSVWYPDGGYYIARSGSFWLCVHCERAPIDAPMGHRHNDQLSFELNVNGTDFFVDPGTGVYTADADLRNRLRATPSHNTVSVAGSEPRAFPAGPDGLFSLPRGPGAAAVSISAGAFSGVHRWPGSVHHRSFTLDSSRLVIQDEVETDRNWTINYIIAPEVVVTAEPEHGDIDLERNGVALRVQVEPNEASIALSTAPFSSVYGRLESATRLTITPDGTICTTVVTIRMLSE